MTDAIMKTVVIPVSSCFSWTWSDLNALMRRVKIVLVPVDEPCLNYSIINQGKKFQNESRYWYGTSCWVYDSTIHCYCNIFLLRFFNMIDLLYHALSSVDPQYWRNLFQILPQITRVLLVGKWAKIVLEIQFFLECMLISCCSSFLTWLFVRIFRRFDCWKENMLDAVSFKLRFTVSF